jgi:hypothetical protein
MTSLLMDGQDKVWVVVGQEPSLEDAPLPAAV